MFPNRPTYKEIDDMRHVTYDSRYVGANEPIDGFERCSGRQRSDELHRLTSRQHFNCQHCSSHQTTTVQ